MRAKIIRVNRDSINQEELAPAIRQLASGGVVIFPTETVYGIGARADLLPALTRLREIKGRESSKAFTLHIADREDVLNFVPDPGGLAKRFMRKAWPGPLTLIFPVGDPSSAPAMQGQPASTIEALYYDRTIGVRCPDDAVARAILRGAGGPVVAASANFAGKPPPHRADEPIAQLANHVDYIIDAGPTQYGRASTIVRLQGRGYALVREGVYDAAMLERLSKLRILFVCTGNTCRSPMAKALAEQTIAARLGCRPEDLEDRGIMISSAGISGGLGGAAENAIAVMQSRGYDLRSHVSTCLTVEMIRQADYIFVMTEGHRESVLRMAPDAGSRVQKLLGAEDLPDPLGLDIEEYERCARQIEQGLQVAFEELEL